MTARNGKQGPSTPPGGRPGPINPILNGPGEYPSVALERMQRTLVPPGTRIIQFGTGDLGDETPEFIRAALHAGITPVAGDPVATGRPALRAAAARWLARRFGVEVHPERELVTANGTKEAVFLLAMALVGREGSDPRRTVVIPSPAYTVYGMGARFAGAETHFAPLRSEDGWRFDPERVPAAVWKRTALLWLNYPHNPTGAVMTRDEYARVVEKARAYGFWVASDEVDADVWFDEPPPTILACGLENVVAFHTLSRRSAMVGYRSGFVAGDPRVIAALRRFRPNVGVATPDFIQSAAIAAWEDDVHAERQRERYAAKRALLLEAFRQRGWEVEASRAGLHLWMRAPEGDDLRFVQSLLKVGLVTTPGSLLGEGGSGYVRWALMPTLEECREALGRLEAVTVAH